MISNEKVDTYHTVRIFTAGGFLGTRGGEAEFALLDEEGWPTLVYTTEFDALPPSSDEDRYPIPDSWALYPEGSNGYNSLRTLLVGMRDG